MARLLLVLTLIVVPGCSAVPDTFTCAHCACSPTARVATRPLLCSTIGRDIACCAPLFLGS